MKEIITANGNLYQLVRVLKEPKIKKKKLMCTTPQGCKVYGIWYE